MKRSYAGYGWFVCLFMVLSSALCGQGGRALVPVENQRGEGSAVIGDYHLLAIGISAYTDPQLRLKTPVNDARKVADVLKERWGFEEGNVTLLLDGEATDEAIERELRRLAKESKAEDAVLIYYAGHGHLDEITEEGSWIPVNATFKTPTRWVSNARVRSLIRAMPARAVLLVSDSCFAGDFFRGGRGVPPEIDDAYVREAMRKRARQALTSGGLEPVMDDGGGGHSVFANFFLAELRQSESTYLLPRDLHRRVAGGVALNAPQQPLIGDLRDTGAELGGEFILFRRGQSRDWEAARAAREAQLSELERAEEAARAAQKERDAEAAKKEAELGELDKRIAELQRRLGLGGGGGGTLSELAALADEKARQAQALVEMRERAEAERAEREREIARLKAQAAAEKRAGFEEDYGMYLKVVESPYLGEAVKRQAWRELTGKYGVEGAGEEPGRLLYSEAGVKLPVPPRVVALGRGVSIEMVWIEPGEFLMGSPSGESGRDGDEGPQTRVRLSKGYWLGKYEVTQGQYQAVMGSNPSNWKGGNLPVEQVTWNEAMEFCKRLSDAERRAGRLPEGYEYTLPTEAQWEYACRAGTTTRFYTGNSDSDLGRAGWFNGNAGGSTKAVGQKVANAWGLYDMHGNVWEWCADWYGDYPGGTVVDPSGARSGSYRVRRGGSWHNTARNCRSAFRFRISPDFRGSNLGFRLALRSVR